MTKLILEAGGRRREFKLGDGKLTLGSGEAARLRVESRELAEVHLELEIRAGALRVIPRPGVVPPSVSGMPRAEPFELPPGKVVSLGKVRLWVEDEADAHAPVVVRSGDASGTRRRGGARRKPTGGNGPHIGVVLGVTVVVLLVVTFFVRRGLEEANLGPPVAATLAAAEEHLRHGNLEIAEEKLAVIRPEAASDAQRDRMQKLRSEIAALREELEVGSANLRGNDFFELHLEHYANKWLTGTPSTEKVRLFLERCQEFRERWPKHPELDWVARQERRFQGHVDLSTPRTWADVEWELKFFVDQPTRNYVRAFEIVDELLSYAEGDDLIAAKERRDALIAERQAYHDEKMEEARREYEDEDNAVQAVWWLVHGVIWIGDDEMADLAARTLARIPDVEAHLRGYRLKYPERLELLLQHPRLEGFAGALDATP